MRTEVEEGLALGSRNSTVDLEPAVADALAECEQKIEEALDGAWHALRKIHDDKLYKVTGHKTFEAYAEKRWGYSKSHAYRLIEHAKLVDKLRESGVSFVPANERISRALQDLRRSSKNDADYEQKVELVWDHVVEHAPKVLDVPQVTVGHVEATVQHLGMGGRRKKRTDFAAAEELRSKLTNAFQCDAFKTTPEAFAKKYGTKCIPSNFYERVIWLSALAEALGGETD